MESLLQKTRRLNKILQDYTSKEVSFMDLSELLSEILDANTYIASKKGKVLGYALAKGYECDVIQTEIVNKKQFPKEYNEEILKYNETKENIKQMTECVFDDVTKCQNPNKTSTIIPINVGGSRLGTLLLAKFDKDFTEDDLILGEYSATIVGMEILKSEKDEIEKEAREKAGVQMAIGTLSYSELEAMEHIFNELDGDEGLLVASKIADRVGITRSVIVNALRKLESAGVIESRSLGMKGTHIKILNDKLIGELEKVRE